MSHPWYGGAMGGLLLVCILPAGASLAQTGAKETAAALAPMTGPALDPAVAKDWMQRWRVHTRRDSAKERYCDTKMGESIGWFVAPYLWGYYYGYKATGETEWVDRLMDWADSVIKRGIKEPDGYIGWPKEENGDVLDYLPPGERLRYTDTEVGEALFFRPVVLMAAEMLKPPLKEKYGAKGEEYLKLSERMFEKWDSRGAWRETARGGAWVVPPFGFDRKAGKWTGDYDRRLTDGNSLPANKENIIASWLLAMYDVTHQPVYRDRAEKWFKLMRARMRLRDDGKYFVWNYWDPSVPWDTNPDGSLKHWQGVHPNGGYYDVDVGAIVLAYEHGLVFTSEDIARLIATNRDFMWNKQVQNAKFRRIDGGEPAQRWENSAGVLWEALAPYDPDLRKVFEAQLNPDDWSGMASTPEWVARYGPKREAGE
jgi:hypothetical protein